MVSNSIWHLAVLDAFPLSHHCSRRAHPCFMKRRRRKSQEQPKPKETGCEREREKLLGTAVRRREAALGRPLEYLIFSLMALIGDPIY